MASTKKGRTGEDPAPKRLCAHPSSGGASKNWWNETPALKPPFLPPSSNSSSSGDEGINLISSYICVLPHLLGGSYVGVKLSCHGV